MFAFLNRMKRKEKKRKEKKRKEKKRKEKKRKEKKRKEKIFVIFSAEIIIKSKGTSQIAFICLKKSGNKLTD